MALKFLTKTQRRELHHALGEAHPRVLARFTRELKRGHRRLARRKAKQKRRPLLESLGDDS